MRRRRAAPRRRTPPGASWSAAWPRGGPVTATELADRLPISRQAVTKHLAALHEAGLVERTRAGRETRYRLTPDPFTDAAAWMAEVGAGWERRLASLRDHVEARTPSRSGARSRRQDDAIAHQNAGKATR